MIQAQRTQYNDFVESGLENQILLSQTTIIVDPNGKKVRINQFYLKKIVLGTIQGDHFLYIFLLNLITSLVSVVTVFFPQFFDPPPFRGFFLFYTIIFLPSPPFTCRSSCWLCFLSHQHLPEVSGSSYKAKNHYSGITSTLMRPESQLQSI